MSLSTQGKELSTFLIEHCITCQFCALTCPSLWPKRTFGSPQTRSGNDSNLHSKTYIHCLCIAIVYTGWFQPCSLELLHWYWTKHMITLVSVKWPWMIWITNHKNPVGDVHDDVIKWRHFPHYWPFVRGIHRSPVNSPHKGQWRGALMFSLICVWINGWASNREAGDLRRYLAHYDVTVMCIHPRDVRLTKSWPKFRISPIKHLYAMRCTCIIYIDALNSHQIDQNHAWDWQSHSMP